MARNSRKDPHTSGPQLLSECLIQASRLLGDEERVRAAFSWAGMPSEYRGRLVAAREQAEIFLRQERLVGLNDPGRTELASRVVEACHAVVFAMRHSLDVMLFVETAACDISISIQRAARG